jgi:hypothetical protein
MLKVELTDFTLADILEIVADLRRQGYKQGTDFDFAYFPEKIESDNFVYHTKQERKLEFTFYDDQLGLLFKLKLGQ